MFDYEKLMIPAYDPVVLNLSLHDVDTNTTADLPAEIKTYYQDELIYAAEPKLYYQQFGLKATILHSVTAFNPLQRQAALRRRGQPKGCDILMCSFHCKVCYHNGGVCYMASPPFVEYWVLFLHHLPS